MFSAKEEKLRNPSYYMRGETFHSEVYSHSRSLHREISRFSRFVAAARATVASLTTSNSSSGSIGRRSGRFVNAVNANVWRINRGACYELSIVLSPLCVRQQFDEKRSLFGLENFDSIRWKQLHIIHFNTLFSLFKRLHCSSIEFTSS